MMPANSRWDLIRRLRVNAVSKTFVGMFLLTASFASPHSTYCWWPQFMYAVFCDLKFSCLIQAIFSLLIPHTVSFLLISSLVFPFSNWPLWHGYHSVSAQWHFWQWVSSWVQCARSFICGHLLLRTFHMRPLAAQDLSYAATCCSGPFICGHLLLRTFSIQLCLSDLQFCKHILSCNQGVCVANTIYEWISAYPGNQVSSLEYVMSVVIVYAVLMFGSPNSSKIALSCLPVRVNCAVSFSLLFCFVISFFIFLSLNLYHLECCLNVFWMVRSLFPLL